MHPRQASLLIQAEEVIARTASTTREAAAALWKYTCPETGKDFYLPEKKTSVKSPWTGKAFSSKPEKDTMMDVAKEVKEDAAAAKEEKKSKKAALLALLESEDA